MVNHMLFGWLGAEKCGCDNGMDPNRCDSHIAMYDIGLPECPEVVVFAWTPSITRIAEDSPVIADSVSFILVDSLYLAGEIINIGHHNKVNMVQLYL